MSEVKIDAAYLSANPLPDHDGSGDKHSRGRVLIIAGSVEVPGAALLAGLGALRSRSRSSSDSDLQIQCLPSRDGMPEAMIIGCRETCTGEIDPSNSVRLVDLAKAADAVLMGPGLIDEAPIAELRAELIGRATMTRAVTFTTARVVSGLGRAVPCTRARLFCIVQASWTAMYARSNRSAAQRNHHARSGAISMSMPETLPGRSLAPRASNSLGVSARRSR